MADTAPDSGAPNDKTDRRPLYLDAWQALDTAMAARNTGGVRAAMSKFEALTTGPVRFYELGAFFGAHTTLAYEPMWLAWNRPEPEDALQTRLSLARLLARRPIAIGHEPRPYQPHMVRIMGIALALRDEQGTLANHDSPIRQEPDTFDLYYPGGAQLTVDAQVSGANEQPLTGPIRIGLGRILDRALERVPIPKIQIKADALPLSRRRPMLVEACRLALVSEATDGVHPKLGQWLDMGTAILTQTVRTIAHERVNRGAKQYMRS